MTQPGPGDSQKRESFADAMAAHRARVAEVLPNGDPAEIKQLYVELGELIDQAVDGDTSAIPALSFPETGPVLGALAATIQGRVLDAGCGPNPIFSIMLGGPDRSLVGLDISPEIVKLAVERAGNAGVTLMGVVGDIEALPFKDSVFNGCVCEDTIEHLPHDADGAQELARVLAPGARLILGTPNRIRFDVLRDKVRDRLRGQPKPASAYYAATSHLREYTWTSLERVIGPWFSVRGRVTTGWSGGKRAQAITALVQRWPFRWVGRMVILDAVPRKS